MQAERYDEPTVVFHNFSNMPNKRRATSPTTYNAFFLSQAHYSRWVSCTRLKGDLAQLLQKSDKVMWGSSSQTHGLSKVTEACIMTVFLHMLRSLSRTFWSKNLSQNWTSTILTRFGLVKLLAIPKKAMHFQTLSTFRHVRREFWRAFKKKGFSNVLNSRNTKY